MRSRCARQYLAQLEALVKGMTQPLSLPVNCTKFRR